MRVVRAIKIADIAPEAKEAAKAAGLANNQKALLTVAQAEPEQQARVVEEIAVNLPRPRVWDDLNEDDGFKALTGRVLQLVRSA